MLTNYLKRHNYIVTIIVVIIINIVVIIIIVIIIIIIIIIQIGKRLHFIRLNHVLFDLTKLSKDTAFMFTFTPFSSVKLAASKTF